MRVLHLIDPAAPGGGPCTLRLLAEAVARLVSVESHVFVIGNRAHKDLAIRCDVPVTGAISPPINHPALARRGLARTLHFYEAAGGAYDLVHAWTASAADLARMVAPGRPRAVTLTVGPATVCSRATTPRDAESAPECLLAATPAVAQAYGAEVASDDEIMVLPPAVNPESVEAQDADELRRRWEIEEGTFVAALLSDPPTWGDARSAVDVVLRVSTTGRPARLLLHPDSSRRAEVERWTGRLGRRELMIVDDIAAEPWRISGAVDAALFLPAGGDAALRGPARRLPIGGLFANRVPRLRPVPCIMPLLWAMSAGVPVIAANDGAIDGVVEEGRTGLVVAPGDLNAVSDRIIRLIEDPTIGGRLGASASEHVRRNFHVSAYCVRLKEVYERLAAGGGRTSSSDHADAAGEVVAEPVSPTPATPG